MTSVSLLLELERLRAENERLKKEIHRWKDGSCCPIQGKKYNIDPCIVAMHGHSLHENHEYTFIGIEHKSDCDFCFDTKTLESKPFIIEGYFYVFDSGIKYKNDPYKRKGNIIIYLSTHELHYVNSVYKNIPLTSSHLE